MRRLIAGSESDYRAADRTAKCPESLCAVPALPLLGNRVPTPRRALLLRLRSYGLMRQSPLALLSFSFSLRSKSLRRSLPAPAAAGFSRRYSRRIFPWMPDPIPRRYHSVPLPVSSAVSSAFPTHGVGRLPASDPLETTSCGSNISGRQVFLYVQASSFTRSPGRPYRCAYCRRAAGALTSGHIVLCCLRTHRIC